MNKKIKLQEQKEIEIIFKNYDINTIIKFQILCLPTPISKNNVIFKIKTKDKFKTCIWGEDKKTIINQWSIFCEALFFE